MHQFRDDAESQCTALVSIPLLLAWEGRHWRETVVLVVLTPGGAGSNLRPVTHLFPTTTSAPASASESGQRWWQGAGRCLACWSAPPAGCATGGSRRSTCPGKPRHPLSFCIVVHEFSVCALVGKGRHTTLTKKSFFSARNTHVSH